MARVRGEAHRDRLAGVRLVGAGGAEVVLHVAGALIGARVVPLELREDLREGLAHGVGEDVEAPAVGHAHHHLAHPLLGGVAQDPVEERDERLSALEREALVPDVAGVEEALEALRLHQLLEHPPLAPAVERRVVAGRLHTLLQPRLPLGVGDVHVLDADRPAVGLAQGVEDLPQGGPVLGVAAGVAPGEELAVEVPEGQAVGGRVEVAVGRAVTVEGVEVGHEVAADAVGVDQLEDLGLLLDLLATAAGSAQEGRAAVSISQRTGRWGSPRSPKSRS